MSRQSDLDWAVAQMVALSEASITINQAYENSAVRHLGRPARDGRVRAMLFGLSMLVRGPLRGIRREVSA